MTNKQNLLNILGKLQFFSSQSLFIDFTHKKKKNKVFKKSLCIENILKKLYSTAVSVALSDVLAVRSIASNDGPQLY